MERDFIYYFFLLYFFSIDFYYICSFLSLSLFFLNPGSPCAFFFPFEIVSHFIAYFWEIPFYLFIWLGSFSLWLRESSVARRGLSRSQAWWILVPQPRIKPASSALRGGFLTTGPPGKSLYAVFLGVHKFSVAESWVPQSHQQRVRQPISPLLHQQNRLTEVWSFANLMNEKRLSVVLISTSLNIFTCVMVIVISFCVCEFSIRSLAHSSKGDIF